MESEVKELELNVAYGTASYTAREENVYENLSPQDLVPPKVDKTINKPGSTAIRYIAGFTLVLACLALLVAVVTAAICFSTPGGIEYNSSSNQDNLQHLIQNLQVELNSSKNDITLLQDQFSSRNSLQTISNLQQRVQTLQLELNSSKTEITILQDQFQEVQTLQLELNSSKTEITILQDQFQEVQTLQAELNDSITAIRRLQTHVWNPVRSCSDIPPGSPSGNYWIQDDWTKSPFQVYCDMYRTSCNCNSAGGWMRVANLDMTDPNQNCPAGFRLVTRTSAPLRTCGRPGPGSGCVSTTFQTYGVRYSHICG